MPTEAATDPEPNPAPDAPAGHSAQIAALFQEHNRTLLSFLSARLKSDQDAREVAQEAYSARGGSLRMRQRSGSSDATNAPIARVLRIRLDPRATQAPRRGDAPTRE